MLYRFLCAECQLLFVIVLSLFELQCSVLVLIDLTVDLSLSLIGMLQQGRPRGLKMWMHNLWGAGRG